MSRAVANVVAFVDRHCLWLLLACYAVAALLPTFGLWLRNVSLGETQFSGRPTKITLPMAMLALLLLNAGLGIRRSQLSGWPRLTLLLTAGLLANIVVPVLFVFLATAATRMWLDPEEVQSILVGLAIVAAMPIAGSSTAWSQNVNGDMTVSLGMVALSTLLSPLTTPLVFTCLSLLAEEETAQLLHRVAAEGAEWFVVACVLAPSLLGAALVFVLGEARLQTARPYLKLLAWIDLLLLVYANAAATLPDAIAYPDVDFLVTCFGTAIALCIATFASGWAIGQVCRSNVSQQTSLMFALGMNNNGAGMVLASLTVADHPRVMLPIITYNLVQHLVAGAAATLVKRRCRATEPDASPSRT
jgi:BASS family bile acid:Na+ symporter